MKKKIPLSHKIWNRYNPHDKIESGREYHIHHINGDHNDNRIENLRKMREFDHLSLHSKGENNSMYGKPTYGHLGKKHSMESIEKNRQAHLGKKHTEEAKKKMSESRCGKNNPFYGRHWSDENKERLSNNMRDYIKENGHPRGMLGKKHSQELKDRFAVELIGKNNPNAKKIIFNGKLYDTIKEACEATGLTRNKIRKCLESPYCSKEHFRLIG